MKRLLCLLLLLSLLFAGCGGSQPAQDTDATASEQLTVHFIDVGQADCILLECAGRYMLIDGGNVDDSSYIVSYLQKQGVEQLDLVVCTHAHEDHVGGLAGVLAVFPTAELWSATTTYSSKCFDNFVRYADQQRLTIQIPQPGKTVTYGKLTLKVLGPVDSYSETNNTSIVIKATFGSRSFLFTGDMEKDAENDMLDSGAQVKADVLKVGHHGSDTSSGYRFLYEVDPQYAVISVGEGNSYGHPHEEPLSRFHDAGVTVYRTDLLGEILVTTDGENLDFSWKNTNKTPETGEEVTHYIGNVNSKVFHLPSCSGLPAEKNQITLNDYDAAIAAGYTPCSRCMG